MSRIFRVAIYSDAMLPITGATIYAASGTSRGDISVLQVKDMLDQVGTNSTARQVLVAYLAGVGETAAALMEAIKAKQHSSPIRCGRRLMLDETVVRMAPGASTGNAGDRP